MKGSPDDRPTRKLTPERAAVWILGIVVAAVLVFAIVVTIFT